MPDTPILSTGLRLVQDMEAQLAQMAPDAKAAVVLYAKAVPGQPPKAGIGVAARLDNGWKLSGDLEAELDSTPDVTFTFGLVKTFK